MPKLSYSTPGGINVTRLTSAIPFRKGLGHLLHKLDRYRGIYLSSGYEYPERYSRWDVASICPPHRNRGFGPRHRIPAAERARGSAEQDAASGCSRAIRIGSCSDSKAPRCVAG